MSIADDFYLAAHDTVRSRCALTPVTLGLGLASGLLAELMLGYRIDVRADNLVVMDQRATDDLATAAVLGRMRLENPLPAREWLAYLAQGPAADLVARRLSLRGRVRRRVRRSLFGTRISYIPADSIIAGTPATRIRAAAGRSQPLGHSDLVLVALILATGLDHHTFATTGPQARAHLGTLLRRDLPAPLRRLVTHTEAAVGDAVLAGRS